jgi:hypothetical protein
VKLIIANERALEQGVRFIDADLNRAFDADIDPAAHEYGLAHRLTEELRGCIVLSLHSTQSYPDPFGIVANLREPVSNICPFLSIVAVAEVDEAVVRMFAVEADLFEVEPGHQGTDHAVANAYRIARELLTVTGVLLGATIGRELPIYRLGKPMDKPPAETYEVLVENFEKVEAGEPYATADGEALTADEAFYPILLSANGYTKQFGYAGRLIGQLEVPDTQNGLR